jgi:hypothetical protein
MWIRTAEDRMINLDHYEHVGIVQNDAKTEWVVYAKLRGTDGSEKSAEIAVLAVTVNREEAVTCLDEISRAPGCFDPGGTRTSTLSHHHHE